ncbi:MAG TPA: bifunctional riboflavin kinase/FAD synthetase [Thermomicrobiales bacterium]|nr:bifunctional riboflavin kinase/FAD synthetase [Thermomicrobiales bacterium]
MFTSFDALPEGATVATIGTFDGVHRGHQHLLTVVRDRARELDVRSLVVTFEPTPAQFFRPASFAGRLVTPEQKVELILGCGIDAVLVHPFDQAFADLTPAAFMTTLVESGHPRELWIGADFALGHARAGNADVLTSLGADLGVAVKVIDRVDIDGTAVSSSAIRKLVAAGEIDQANTLLGHRFAIPGEVIKGAQVGRTIGYPTANVPLPEDLVLPSDGIYATYAQIGDDPAQRPAMTYIGTRPALNTGSRLIETHLIDFVGDLYGQELTTSFVRRLRPDSDFVSVELLVKQLQDDEVHTREVLGLAPATALSEISEV